MSKAETRLSKPTEILVGLTYGGLGVAGAIDFANYAIQDFSMNPGRISGDIVGLAVGVIVAVAGGIMAVKEV